ncbi:MAG: Piwi domain-containing protein [Bacteroidetes bacterium]|nr:Piwi domain-containing protein [Bacteroidota bacterium]
MIGFDGIRQTIATDNVYLEPNISNINDYIHHSHRKSKNTIVQKIREKISMLNGGENKKQKIDDLKKYLQSVDLKLVNGTTFELVNALEIQDTCKILEKPIFVFNNNGEATWVETGLVRDGPYTKRTFDRNDPSVCVICYKHDKGVVEQFIRKLLKGIPRSKYFQSGLEGKFDIGTSRVEVFSVDSEDISGYESIIRKAIGQKMEYGEKWDLALVQVKQSFKNLPVTQNPYYRSKQLFLMHKIPVQNFTTELVHNNDSSLGFSLNNMALACYAKMGGIPWLLKCSPTLSHELVIGVGSANIGEDRGVRERVMGITTIFSGDGSYIVSNTTRAVKVEAYCTALSELLENAIDKISKKMNWQRGDTIRLVFHASVKKFNNDEIQAVKTVINKFSIYQIEYAFLKISDHHGLHMFDTSTMNFSKGKYAPERGKMFNLSHYESLIYLIGNNQLKTNIDGHPRGVILSIHKDSSFQDLKYLSSQLFNFSSHSWRSYFPNSMPVTISYADLIARSLGWLNKLPNWNDDILIGKIGQTQWFL